VIEARQVGRAAAHVEIDGYTLVLRAVCKRSAPLAGDGGLQIRSRGGNHELSREVGDLRQHLRRVFLSGRLARHDHGPGGHIRRPDARFFIFSCDNAPNGRTVDSCLVPERRQMDLAFIDHPFFQNADIRRREKSGRIIQRKPAEHHLGGGGADVDAHAQDLFQTCLLYCSLGIEMVTRVPFPSEYQRISPASFSLTSPEIRRIPPVLRTVSGLKPTPSSST